MKDEFLLVLEDQSAAALGALMKAVAKNDNEGARYFEGQLVALAVVRFIWIRDFLDDRGVGELMADDFVPRPAKNWRPENYEEELNARYAPSDD